MARKNRFDVPALDVQLAGSRKKRPRAHIVGRPDTNYYSKKPGSNEVDGIADQLGCSVYALRNAVLTAHTVGSRKIIEYNNRDRFSQAEAGLRALQAVCELVYDPSFIPAIRGIVPIVATEHSSYGESALEAASAFERIPLLEGVLADQMAVLKPEKRKNPGKPYMAGLAESLVDFWRELTGTFPAKTHKDADRPSKSHRLLFWKFMTAALVDLRIKKQPIEALIRSAIDRLEG